MSQTVCYWCPSRFLCCAYPLLQIEDYSLVSFVPLNIAKTSSVEIVLAHVDNALQYGEDMEPKIPKDLDGPEPAPPPEE